MTWSNTALREYLYGIRQNEDPDAPGTVNSQAIKVYTWQNKEIPAGFFNQPDSEHISAVLANPEGTLSKFNRMGFISNFGDRDIVMMRRGLAYQGGLSPEFFVVTEIDEAKYSESWCEGLEVFHNPNALVPLPEFSLPGVAHTTVRDGQIVSSHPPFFPIGSMTLVLVATKDMPTADQAENEIS